MKRRGRWRHSCAGGANRRAAMSATPATTRTHPNMLESIAGLPRCHADVLPRATPSDCRAASDLRARARSRDWTEPDCTVAPGMPFILSAGTGSAPEPVGGMLVRSHSCTSMRDWPASGLSSRQQRCRWRTRRLSSTCRHGTTTPAHGRLARVRRGQAGRSPVHAMGTRPSCPLCTRQHAPWSPC